ncbi:MAG: hypothetical protein WC248_08910 [Candidatus Methanomethylophilaceae archaeon]
MSDDELLLLKYNKKDSRAMFPWKALLIFLDHHNDTPWGYDTPIKTEMLIEFVRGELYGGHN